MIIKKTCFFLCEYTKKCLENGFSIVHRGADIDISCTFAVLHGGISVATTILNNMLHTMATMLFGYHNLFAAMLEIGTKNLPETMKAVEQHSNFGMKSMLDKPVKIDTTAGKFKKESMHVFTLFQVVEKRLQFKVVIRKC